ncbi:MAG: murein L,D-transpeptidase catalytic domain family protein [Pseudomonadota bacterium]|nr:murein L,D-transpeptidase catalytic domain family protein [Pseudomonadota bacterium]
MAELKSKLDRRALVRSGGAVALGAFLFRSSAFTSDPAARATPSARAAAPGAQTGKVAARAAPDPVEFPVNRGLLERARQAMETHASSLRRRDRIALIDFSEASSERRMHLLDLEAGKATQLLVSHGSGSDPAHTGFVQSFSNAVGSNASSRGAYVTSNYYVGKHGRSQRLSGLDATNDNALQRAIVLHSAWYANPDMLRTHGMLGRSQGCFAVGEKELDDVFAFLGEGRMIYADRA